MDYAIASRFRSWAVVVLALSLACGTDDYQKPVANFQDATTAVVTTARDMLSQVNTVEQNAVVDRAVFEHAALDLEKVQALCMISQAEIDVRYKALDQLKTYASILALLASGKATTDLSTEIGAMGTSLSGLATDAAALPVHHSSFLKNGDLGTCLGSTASVIGALAKDIQDHKNRAALDSSIKATEAPVNNLLTLLSTDLGMAYQRQLETLNAQGMYFANLYKAEQSQVQSDRTKLLLLGDRIKATLQKKSALPSADPVPTLDSMKAAHKALVAYAQSTHSPKSLGELLLAAQTFQERAKPFADAYHAFRTLK